MRILTIHNHYQQAGGEDKVFESETSLLRKHGHEVFTYTKNNAEISKYSSLKLAAATVWNRESSRAVSDLVRAHGIELVHLHNTLPLVSPAVLHAAKATGAATVRTLHNYRLNCAAGTYYRNGQICQLCQKKSIAYPAIQHACYRSSRAASTVAIASQAVHHLLGTHQHKVDRYIALSEFTKAQAIEGGLPEAKISIKPNFLFKDPGIKKIEADASALYIGRLSSEKGIAIILAAFAQTGAPLKIVGNGPLQPMVESATKRCPSIQYLGEKQHNQLIEEVKQAAFVVVPSIWYETFGLVAIESFACGTPVLASRIGSLQSIIKNRVNGLHFSPGDVADLCEKLNWAFDHLNEMQAMGVNARQTFETHYTAKANYTRLMQIYQEAIEASHAANA